VTAVYREPNHHGLNFASPMTSEFVSSACPHDCPSTCALEVERLDDHTIGRVRGAADHDYTLGVICDKVARYRERIHHPDRLGHPLKRIGPKGSGRFEQVSWDEALDEVAEAFKAATDEYGAQSVWPFHYAGTMGLVQRDGIHRFRHALGYSGLDETICVTLARKGWIAGVGALWGTDARDMAQSDLIVIWGTNPVSTQVNVMTHVTKARKERGAKVVCIDPYRTQTAKSADIHLAVRPGTDGALACGVMHVLFAKGMPTGIIWRAIPTARTAWKNICKPGRLPGRPKLPAWRKTTSSPSRGCSEKPNAVTSVSAMAFHAAATAPRMYTRLFVCPP